MKKSTAAPRCTCSSRLEPGIDSSTFANSSGARSWWNWLTLKSLPADGRANVAALLAVGFCSLVAGLQYSPEIAGSDVVVFKSRSGQSNIVRITAAKPVNDSGAISSAEVNASITAAPATPFDQKMAMLERGIAYLESIPDYTAQFLRQEFVGDCLLDEQEMAMKVRHAPFSVYLKWISKPVGREVLYVAGDNDGEFLVREAGWKSKLGTMSLAPDSALAMQDSRHPVTQAGILELAKTIRDHHVNDRKTNNIRSCVCLGTQEFDSRPCTAFLVEYASAELSPMYRRSLTLFDQEWSIPVYIKNFGWPEAGAEATGDELDAATLLEFYAYTNVKLRALMTADAFDRQNADYRLQ